MGMDVYGKEPTSDEGVYFRATVWGWGPLYVAMERSCRDLLSKELLFELTFNEGAGPADQATCTEIADRLERLLETSGSAFRVDTDLRVDGNGRFLSTEQASALGPDQVGSPYQVDAEFVRKWIAFLRHCGGFAVW